MKPRHSRLPAFLLLLALVAILLVAMVLFVPTLAWQSFGAPGPALDSWQRFSYALDLVWNAGDLTQPRDPAGVEQVFVIQPGESVPAISNRLEEAGLIRSAETFRIYLLWTGTDTIIASGTYRLSPAQTGRDIARSLKSTTLTDVPFDVLPGWRMEEIAASLPTSGLPITPEAFLAAASAPANAPDFLPAGASAEGFLSPGAYTLPRSTSADQLVFLLLQNFSFRLTPELRSGFASHGLSVYQAVTLASIIQREAMVDGEMPLIASVFYNRLAINMPLQTDPTIQYALGYDAAQGTWWTNPLSLADLKIDSPYNTYLYRGLPPGPISNPGMAALQAVASPAQSKYYYFQARCDRSGLHNFAETLAQHQQNNCP
ncbi:MAG: endolytic transglycosylase MltG [Anaerolineales bacterium]